MEIFEIQQVLRFLVKCLSSWIAGGSHEAKRLITTAIFEDNAIIYVKKREKGMWLWNLLLDDERKRMYIETLVSFYENMEFI